MSTGIALVVVLDGVCVCVRAENFGKYASINAIRDTSKEFALRVRACSVQCAFACVCTT